MAVFTVLGTESQGAPGLSPARPRGDAFYSQCTKTPQIGRVKREGVGGPGILAHVLG